MKKQQSSVLIVGASFAGLAALRRIHRSCQVTMVDIKDYFEFTPSILECFVAPQKLSSITIPMTRLKAKFRFRFIHGKLITIEDKNAIIDTESGQINQSFDFCLLSTGSIQNRPIKASYLRLITLSQRIGEINDTYENIRQANQILVIGGGTVGVEIAAGLAHTKSVTLVARHQILNSMPKRAQTLARERLTFLGVTLHENTTYSPEQLKAFPLIFECTGNTFPKIQTNGFRLKLSKTNQLTVDAHTRVVLSDSLPSDYIMAVGDVALGSQFEEKTAFGAEIYAETAAHNILMLSRGQKTQLARVPYITKLYSISLGRRNAILVFEQICIGGYIGWLMKIMVERTKMLQVGGVIGFEMFWRFAHFVTNILTALYMLFDALIGQLPIRRSLNNVEENELKNIQKEYNLKFKKQ